MLFGRAVIGFSCLIATLALTTFLHHVRLRPYDGSRYRKLIQESAEIRSRRALERHPAHQMREGVQKDIWAVDGTERPHFRLNSGYSELTITQKRDKFDAVEELQQINCWFQDDIDATTQMQQIRTLTAREGTYYYPSHRFVASAVHLSFYRVPGIELPSALSDKPFLTSMARQATFAAAGKNPTFTAYDVTATLDVKKR